MLHHCSFYWSSVKLFLANCFLIIGDHFRLHFDNIRQCQLTISRVAMVTCGPIVFPKVLWMQHLRIIFDFNALDRMEIFKSIPMVVNWYKIEIAQYFYKWCFFYINYQIENMNRKGIMWVKASEGTAMPCGFTRHPQHGMGKITIKVLWIYIYCPCLNQNGVKMWKKKRIYIIHHSSLFPVFHSFIFLPTCHLTPTYHVPFYPRYNVSI